MSHRRSVTFVDSDRRRDDIINSTENELRNMRKQLFSNYHTDNIDEEERLLREQLLQEQLLRAVAPKAGWQG